MEIYVCSVGSNIIGRILLVKFLKEIQAIIKKIENINVSVVKLFVKLKNNQMKWVI